MTVFDSDLEFSFRLNIASKFVSIQRSATLFVFRLIHSRFVSKGYKRQVYRSVLIYANLTTGQVINIFLSECKVLRLFIL